MTLCFLILLSLCTLIYSDSFLSHFQDIATDDIDGVALELFVDFYRRVHKITTPGPEKSPKESKFDGSFESCAEQCLLTKFYCRSFMVVALKGEMQCIMDYNRLNNLMDYFTDVSEENPRSAKLVLAYEFFSHFNGQGLYSSIKKKMDNVEAITKYSTLLQDHKFDEILRGYGGSKSLEGENWDAMVAFLELCAAALNVPKSRPKNFRKWLNGEESFYEHSMSVSTSKSTDNYEHVSKRQKVGDRPDFNLLMFLDLVSRTVDRNTETTYDPEEGTLYIHSPDIQVLFISHDKDDYIWAASGKKISTSEIHVGISKPEKHQDILDTVIGDFVKAEHRLNPEFNVRYDPELYDPENSKLWRLITYLTKLESWEWVLDHEDLLFQDFSQSVPIIHEIRHKSRMPYTEQVRKSFPRELVAIITQ